MKTLLKHSAIYLLARGVPGVVNFLAIAVYTRLISPDEYGRYALVLAGAGFANMLVFHWLGLAVLRFLPASDGTDAERLLATIRATYRWLVIGTASIGLVILPLLPSGWRLLLVLALALLWTQGWFEINLQMLRAKLDPMRYGLASGIKALVAIGTGVLVALYYPTASAPVAGQIIGFALAGVMVGRALWKGILPSPDWSTARQVMQYGIPLCGTLALGYLLNTSDRFLIAYFIDERAAGVYSAGYDLASQVLLMVMLVVNTAAFPLILNDLEGKGVEAARQQLSRNMWLLLAVAAPATAAMVMFAPQIAQTILGRQFHETAISLIPWIAVATLLNGLRSYHFDLAFQLGQKTIHQLWVMGSAIVVNLSLNLVWIPQKGVIGAAWSTLVAYAVALLVSLLLGRRFFRLPINWRAIGQVGVALAVMGVVWQLSPHGLVSIHWLLVAAAALCVYGCALTVAVMCQSSLGQRFRRSFPAPGNKYSQRYSDD